MLIHDFDNFYAKKNDGHDISYILKLKIIFKFKHKMLWSYRHLKIKLLLI